MEYIFADIYQKVSKQKIHGICIKDKSRTPITEENIVWWLISNILRNHKLSISVNGFVLYKKIYIDVEIHRTSGIKKEQYIFSVSDDVDKRFKYEGEYYTIRKTEKSLGKVVDLRPIIDTIEYSTIEKNKNFSFLISVPMRD